MSFFTWIAGAETFEYSSPLLASTSMLACASVPMKFSAWTIQTVLFVVGNDVGVQSCQRNLSDLEECTGMTTAL
jgi:hypothetical protein